MTDNSFSPPLLKLIDLNAYDVFSGMILAFILCFILSRLVRVVSTDAASDKNLPKTMIFLGAIVSLIMAVIGNSLARAFGAIGALSLIRFRTAVKSPNDLAYLFMSIAVGMACGSGYFSIATGATGLFSIFIILVEKLVAENYATKVSLLKISYSYSKETNASIVEALNESVLSHRSLNEECASEGKIAEMLVEITLKDKGNASELLNKITSISSGIKASIILD